VVGEPCTAGRECTRAQRRQDGRQRWPATTAEARRAALSDPAATLRTSPGEPW
jgi:hypothetical protein